MFDKIFRLLSCVLCICLIIFAALTIYGCSSHEEVERYTDKDGVVHERVVEGSSLGEHLAGAAVAGAAAGAAGAVGHRVADHAINKWEERKEVKSRDIRTRNRTLRIRRR